MFAAAMATYRMTGLTSETVGAVARTVEGLDTTLHLDDDLRHRERQRHRHNNREGLTSMPCCVM